MSNDNNNNNQNNKNSNNTAKPQLITKSTTYDVILETFSLNEKNK